MLERMEKNYAWIATKNNLTRKLVTTRFVQPARKKPISSIRKTENGIARNVCLEWRNELKLDVIKGGL